jgi:hypothetical protein
MHHVSLPLLNEEGNLIETISAVFEPTEIELLRRFVQFVDSVRNTKLVLRGMPVITNMNLIGMKFTCSPYDNSELHELLHVLRPLILQDEATSFNNVAGILGKRFSNQIFRAHLKLQRKVFEDGEFNLYMQISLNDRSLFNDSTLKLWLNGKQYHTDEENAETWGGIESALNTENTRAFVISQLHSKVKALFNLQHTSKLVLGKVNISSNE